MNGRWQFHNPVPNQVHDECDRACDCPDCVGAEVLERQVPADARFDDDPEQRRRRYR